MGVLEYLSAGVDCEQRQCCPLPRVEQKVGVGGPAQLDVRPTILMASNCVPRTGGTKCRELGRRTAVEPVIIARSSDLDIEFVLPFPLFTRFPPAVAT